MRILFWGDDTWAVQSLENLVKNGHHILGVVIRESPTNSLLNDYCKEVNLLVFQPTDANSVEFVEVVRNLAPELNISVSYDQIIKEPLLSTAPRGFINVHASKLPYYRGRRNIIWAIINGEEEIGITSHYINEGIDTGDIILQRTIPVLWTDTYTEVLENVVQVIPQLVQDTVQLIGENQIVLKHQNILEGTYVTVRKEEDNLIDWTDISYNIYNKIRALNPPELGAYTVLNEQKITLWKATYSPDWPQYIGIPGEVIGKTMKGVFVKTGDSVILLEQVQYLEKVFIPKWRIGTRFVRNYYYYELSQMAIKLQMLETEILSLREDKTFSRIQSNTKR